MKKLFYVYIYLDPRRPGKYYYPGTETTFLFEPFYVGKGSKYRLNKHLNSVKSGSKYVFNSFKVGKIKHILNKGLQPEIMILENNISEKKSFELEKKTIFNIGRKDLKKGPLCNFTNGGEGSSGRKLSETTKDKIRQKAIGRKASQETKDKMKTNNTGTGNPMYGKKSAMAGKTHSLESIQKMKKPKPEGFNQHLKGKRMPEKTRKKISEANMGLKAIPINVYDVNWNFIKKCNTKLEAEKFTGVSQKDIDFLIENGMSSKKRSFKFKLFS